ncbi:hypothetical protein NA655_08490 [Pseudomonas kuykendallii]|nr:hypothetical protein [Pseudomonas kuykendallii]MCQ4271057.1 hypothetical protein [Pseudomonas kuykendallii]
MENMENEQKPGEKPDAYAALIRAASLAEIGVFEPDSGIQIGGHPMEREGWGKASFVGVKAHLFRPISSDRIGAQGRERQWVSLCGVSAVSTSRWPMFEAGSWERCRVCESKVRRRPRGGAIYG